MAVTPQRLVERLLQEGEKTRQFFDAMPAIDWDVQVYSEGSQWRIRQVLAHFVVTEASIQRLIKNIQDGGEGAPLDFDIDRFNESRVSRLEGASPSELISQFCELRQQTAQLVACLNSDDLQRTGRHPFLGVTSLEEIIKLMYRHNQIHQRDIRKNTNLQ